ncbi:MAG TPA: histidine kinase [Amycolatopsis sp.]|nr:histidine kinase [Amycolatopsis sp.]
MPAQPRGTPEVDRRAWLVASVIVAVVFCSYCVIGEQSLLGLWQTPGLVVLGVLCTGVLLSIQLLYFGRPSVQLSSTRSHLMLLAQALLGYLPLLVFGQGWIGLPGFVAGSVLLVLRPPLSWVAFGVVMASMGVIQEALSDQALDVAYTTVAIGLSGLEVFLLTRLTRLVTELYAARTELAKGAVAEERLRFARDLHDLLGLSLSAIALKGELALRLMRKQPERARPHLEEINGIARRTLSDVRSVASGYRELSLKGEGRIARSLLAASDIEAEIDVEAIDLPVQIRAVLATVLREGVMNVLRHTGVEDCVITLRQETGLVSLDMVNDGVLPETADAESADADGVRMLGVFEQVTELGGTVTAEPDAKGRFRLHAEIPLPGDGSGRGRRQPPRPDEQSPQLGSRVVRALVATVFSGMCLAALLHLLYLTEEFWHVALSAGYLAALLVLQLSYFSRPSAKIRSRQGYGLLFVQACLIYLPLIQLKENWISLPGLLAGSALLVLRPAAGWTVFAAVIGSVVWVHAGFAADPRGIPFNALATVNTGLIVFGLSWLTRLATDLDATRRRLAGAAVAEERLRFARDLHDLLGLSLSAIALKTELTDRLLVADTERASIELVEILQLSRQALADVRSVADGYRELSLLKESRSVEAVLTAAEVEVLMELELGELPAQVGTVLAVVLREGVTNVLRHSKVERCEIAVRHSGKEVRLEIFNDGVTLHPGAPETIRPGEAAGNGLRNLSDRVGTLGGELTAGHAADGRYCLRAVVPT